MNMDVSGNFA